MTMVTVAATQMACSWAAQGAQVILLPELFETPYFCIDQSADHFALATPVAENPAVNHFRAVARELQVVLPISFFERANNAYYNTTAVIDADGSVLGVYRKTHIPNGPGYQEKQFFHPGDTGFKVWPTRYGTIGLAICWDQWFPETARILALMGAELLLYPTAIGSEPQDKTLDSKDHWQLAQQGHAAANLTPLIASNRFGPEHSVGDPALQITFYGSSFICDETGAMLEVAGRSGEAVLVQRFDLDAVRKRRAAWGVFRDRRPQHYGLLLTADGGAL
jgi:N-carbamoylputrescine amidase